MSGAHRILQAPSLLDRLLDDAPEVLVDASRTRQQQLRGIRAALGRDLEALLNTRCCPVTPPPGLTELRASLLAYGTPDFIGVTMVSRDQRQAFARKLEATIRTFEPRLRDVAVTVLDARNATERMMRLRINATAILHEDTAAVTFASALDPTTLLFRIAEERGGAGRADGDA